MREYLLLLLIAFTGLSGLFSIHRDVKIQSQQQLILYPQVSTYFSPQAQGAAIETSQRLDIFQGEYWSEVHFNILDFQKDEDFMLDFGNGDRITLEEAHTKILYEKPGTYFVKLFKDRRLVEANEIELLRPEISL